MPATQERSEIFCSAWSIRLVPMHCRLQQHVEVLYLRYSSGAVRRVTRAPVDGHVPGEGVRCLFHPRSLKAAEIGSTSRLSSMRIARFLMPVVRSSQGFETAENMPMAHS